MSSFVQVRRLFLLDFICATLGALFYYLLFDFIVETLALPQNIVQTQLFANIGYAIYGLALYISKTGRLNFFKFLIAMNFIYVALCLVTGLIISLKGIYWGALLLLAEAFLIWVLARYERNLIRSF